MMMRVDPRKEPLSTTDPAFLETFDEAIASGRELIVLVRFNRSAGTKDCFRVKNKADFSAILNVSRPADSISVFLKDPVPIRGTVDDELEKNVLAYLKSQLDRKEDVVLLRLDGPGPKVKEWSWTDSAEELSAWLRECRGTAIAVGHLPFWSENSDAVLTAYVPDPDGKVRPGSY